MSKYIKHHYVPIWYQKLFIPKQNNVKSLYYLDKNPKIITERGHICSSKDVNWWGPSKCFYGKHLYSIVMDGLTSTEIEEVFFGEIDRKAKIASELLIQIDFDGLHNRLSDFITFMCLQRMRTPKGLRYLSILTQSKDKNSILLKMQELKKLFGSIWAECQWCILDASESATKFIVTDHPITTYNSKCYPLSNHCKKFNDPDIRYLGTHTIYPLSSDKLLVLTNLEWYRNPYTNPLKLRKNPNYMRRTIFNFFNIQIGRKLTEKEVIEFNFILKSRAYRYIAAGDVDWLYPEKYIKNINWDRFAKEYLLMPDPRSSIYSSEVVIGYEGGLAESFDSYGQRPWQKGYADKNAQSKEQQTFRAFKGEYARKFGPKRRGITIQQLSMDGYDKAYVDDEKSHQYHTSIPPLKKYK